MTTQEKKEFIRLQCIKVNPSILDLVFGCEVKIDGFLSNTIVYVYPPAPDGEKCVRLADNSQFAVVDLEIIGREISLADILLAIDKNLPAGMWEVPYNVDDDDHEESSYVEQIVEYWNLLLPFHLQDDSTIDFIFNLLQ